VASGPTGYLIGKGVEYSAPYLPQSAQHALGKVGETLDNATTKMSTGTVGFLVSDENQNIGTYYEGTQTNSENGQSLAQDRVDGTKMVLGAMVSAVGVGAAWKGVTSDAKAVKNGAGDVKSGAKEKIPGAEDNEAGHSAFGGNGGKEPKSGSISQND